MLRVLHTLNKPDRPVGKKQERKSRDRMRTGKMGRGVKGLTAEPCPMSGELDLPRSRGGTKPCFLQVVFRCSHESYGMCTHVQMYIHTVNKHKCNKNVTKFKRKETERCTNGPFINERRPFGNQRKMDHWPATHMPLPSNNTENCLAQE